MQGECIVSRRVLSPLPEEERQQHLTQAHLHPLSERMEVIPDPRGKQGVRDDLPFLLTCLIAALLGHWNSTEAVSQWCRQQEGLLRALFGPRLCLTPRGSLSRWVLPQIAVQTFEQVVSRWVRASSQASATDPLAVDGKPVRGARTAERDAPHLLSCFTHQRQEVWAEGAVGEKTNAMPEARKRLPLLPSEGRVCTFEALHSHRQVWHLVRSQQAYPLCVIKGNEPIPLPGQSRDLLCRSVCSVPGGTDSRSPPWAWGEPSAHREPGSVVLSCCRLARDHPCRPTHTHADSQGRDTH
ncbi:MAG: transposase family protein [Chloroflexota bacterium]|nr:transposase family protein [Chloroflexota bacterium]